MPRRAKDPIIPVMNYFETATIDAALQALQIGEEIIRRRTRNAAVPYPPVRRRKSKPVGGDPDFAPSHAPNHDPSRL